MQLDSKEAKRHPRVEYRYQDTGAWREEREGGGGKRRGMSTGKAGRGGLRREEMREGGGRGRGGGKGRELGDCREVRKGR